MISKEEQVKKLFEENSADFFGTKITLNNLPYRMEGGAQNQAYCVENDGKKYVVKVLSSTLYPNEQEIAKLEENEAFAESLKEKGCATVPAIKKKDGTRAISSDGLTVMVYPHIAGEKVDNIEDPKKLEAMTRQLSKILENSRVVTNSTRMKEYDFTKFQDLKARFISQGYNATDLGFKYAEKFILEYNEIKNTESTDKIVFTHDDINQYNCIFTTDKEGNVEANIIDWESCGKACVFRVFMKYAVENCRLWDAGEDLDIARFRAICSTFLDHTSLVSSEFNYAYTLCGASFVSWLQKNLENALDGNDELVAKKDAIQTCYDVLPAFEKMERNKEQMKFILQECIRAQQSKAESHTRY